MKWSEVLWVNLKVSAILAYLIGGFGMIGILGFTAIKAGGWKGVRALVAAIFIAWGGLLVNKWLWKMRSSWEV